MSAPGERLVEVRLSFKAPADADPDEFGERVLCMVERLPGVSTDDDGDLHSVSHADHEHDCYEEWALIRDETRVALAAWRAVRDGERDA